MKPRRTVILLMDDLGIEAFEHFGRGGTPPGVGYAGTPHLNAFMAGTVDSPCVAFDRWYVMQLCSPTRVALWTGRYPFETGQGTLANDDGGVAGSAWAMQTGENSFPRALAGDGREFAYIGKWHASSTSTGGVWGPLAHGWQWFEGHERNLSTSDGNGYRNYPEDVNGEIHNAKWFLTEAQFTKGIQYLRRKGNDPCVLVISCYGSHLPTTGTANTPPAAQYQTGVWGAPPLFDLVAANKAHTECIDFNFGRLLAEIDFTKDLVIVTTDNGTDPTPLAAEYMLIDGVPVRYSSDHGKNTPYEPAVCVFSAWRGVGVTGASRTDSSLTSAVDLIPTLRALFELPALDSSFRGVSLAPILNGSGPSGHTYVWSENFRPNGVNYGTTTGDRAVISDRYKIVRRNTTATDKLFEFYDLKPTGTYNPMELVNLTPGGSKTGLTAPQLAALDGLEAFQAALLVEPV